MNSSNFKFALLCALLSGVMLGSSAWAQNEPYAGYIYPAGGQQGTTFQATLGGRHLNPTAIFCTGEGVHATIVQQERQVTPTEQKEMQETLSTLRKKRENGQRVTAKEAQIAERIKQVLTNFGRRLSNPALGEFVTLNITVAQNAEPGDREIRLLTPSGLSNPLRFNIGELSEFSKEVWKDIPQAKESMEAKLDPKPPAKNITLPITVNGQIPPGGADRYRIPARAGQQLTVAVRARELIPYISDAVPGWFQAVVTLRDGNGNELPYTNNHPFAPDPTLVYNIATDGEYTLEINDALYRGREDFIYRINIGSTTPPPAMAPKVAEETPNNTIATAQPVTIPALITEYIDRPSDMDVFRFDGKKNESIVAEIHARRAGSPLDSLLILTDATGQQIAFNDDHEDKGSGLNTHHADSYLSIILPATGAYFLHVGDTQQAGGATFRYKLRMSEPRPDYELRITPSSLNVHGGASTPMTAHVLRRDGFSGAIDLKLNDAPSGFTLSGARIPANQDQIRFTLNAPASTMEPFDLQIEGHAIIDHRIVIRDAVPADDQMQAFSYRHLVPAQKLKVAVTGRFRAGGDPTTILSPMPIQISVSGSDRVRVQLPRSPLSNQVEFSLHNPPDGITLKESTASQIVLVADPEKIKVGSAGNLIVNVVSKPKENGRHIPMGSLPAIAYQIVEDDS